ncbi:MULTISPECIES: hypothetical protein [Gordonia]|uniref:hypothetical protein n=1 Tax=Gordonia TaxID=2053 RepID=UPI000FDCF562|nr:MULTISPECIES: hypothetical protein [Gordonia]AZZ83225.1 hypothetical protein C5O27_20980 [Gordonia alkanivorans]MDH3013384.1 hypothetical protein [Gordonia alkanivorans]WJG14624.1 hypothetical protein PWF70_06360 [Gordonia sp. Swx-4]
MLPRLIRRSAAVFAVAAVTFTMAGCSADAPVDRRPSTTASEGAKVVTAGPGRDIEPVARRFPLLADGNVDGWAAGTLGSAPGASERVPGPTTYWFDAVVDVGPGRATAWADEYHAEPVPAPVSVAADVRDLVPTGDLVGGPHLDDAFSSDEWRATVYLSPSTGRVVVLGIDD